MDTDRQSDHVLNPFDSSRSKKHKQFWLMLGCSIVAFILGTMLVLPLYGGRNGLNVIQEFFSANVDDVVCVAALSTYYFNAHDEGGEQWSGHPSWMVDGVEANSADTLIDVQVQLCDGNTCDGTDLGTITKVEIRAKIKYSGIGTPKDVILRPVFSGGDGTNHANTATLTLAWTSWIDITTDGAQAPSPWTWSDVDGLDCDVESDVGIGITVACSKIEIQVTYDEVAGREYANFTITQSSTPLYFNSTSAINYNVNASSQTASICALNISNDESFPINITIALNNSIGNGIHLKWANAFTPPSYSTSYDNWYQKRKNSVQHASTSGGTAPIANNTVFTINATGSDEIRGTPLIVDNMLYVCGFGDTTNGGHDNISAWWLSNHTRKWAYDINGSRGSPLYYNGCLYVSSTPDTIADARFYCIWADNGTLRWEKDITNDTTLMVNWQSSPSVDVETNQVFISHGTYLHAFNATTGDWNWHINFTALNMEDPMAGIPTVDTDFVYYQSECNEGAGNGTYCIWKNNGTVKWNLTGNDYNNPKASPIVVGDYVYIAGRLGNISKVLRVNGTVEDVWSVGGVTLIGGLSYYDEVIFTVTATASTPKLHAIYISNMTEKWNYSGVTSAKLIECSPAIADGYVYFTSTDGYAHCLWESNGTLCWNYTIGTKSESDIAISDGILAFNANNWSTYVLGTQSIYNDSSSDYYETDNEIEVGTVEEHPKDKVVRTLAGSSYELVYLWADFYNSSVDGEITRTINVTSRNTTMGAYSYDEVTLKFNYTYVAPTRSPTQVFDYWFNCGNETIRTPTQVFDYWFSCGNETTRIPTGVFNYWWQCGNTSTRNPTQIFNHWFSCGNTSVRSPTKIFDYYFNCGNETTRTPTRIFNYWFACGNVSVVRTPTQVFNYWFSCGNETIRSPTQVFNHWFACGNISTRVPTQAFNYWFSCGNTSIRTPTQVFDYWFNCGNGTRSPTQVFDYWFACGNGTTRTPTQVFDCWFACGNTTIILQLTDEYPVNGSNIFSVQPTLFFTLNSPVGNMSYSIYIGNTNTTADFLIDSVTGVGNGTYHYVNFYNASSFGTWYYYRIYYNDSNSHVNETFSFRPVQSGGMGGVGGAMSIIGLCGLFAIPISYILYIKLKKRKEPVSPYPPNTEVYSRRYRGF